MTLTENEPITPPADTLGRAGPGRRPIDDVGAYLDSLPHDARLGLRTLGELLVGVTQQAPRAETADRFTARALGVENAGQLVDEERGAAGRRGTRAGSGIAVDHRSRLDGVDDHPRRRHRGGAG